MFFRLNDYFKILGRQYAKCVPKQRNKNQRTDLQLNTKFHPSHTSPPDPTILKKHLYFEKVTAFQTEFKNRFSKRKNIPILER